LKKSKRSHASRKAYPRLPQFFAAGAFPDETAGGSDCDVLLGRDGSRCPDPASGDKLEEIVVTGLRQSLITSESIKRESPGVVDAITAEDIGKFPIPISPNRSNAFRA